MADDGNVQVFCRVRPPNEREGGATAFTKKCVTVPSSDPLQQTVLLQLKGMGAHATPKTFTFDRVFHELSSQNEVFELVGVPITRACLEGYNGTIFAYGQTGSGKTFTMQGPDDVIDADARLLTDKERGLRGLVPRVFDYLFQDAHVGGPMRVSTDAAHVEHTFACSFMEIYNERVYDLLDLGSTRDAAGLTLRENGRKGVSVEGLIESVVTNAKQAAELMAVGARNRRVGQTAMNRESSRSHSVFVLQIQSKETTTEGITRTRLSRFNLVDLAGSERQRNTEAAGDRLKEAGSINKSLSALGNVIMGLVEQSAGKNRHVHYRDSKLTFLLKDSLGGNSKTFMIATVSPAEDSSHETLSTLKFAQRAKLIRNNAVINEDTSGSVLVLQEEIIRLRRQLQEAHRGRSDLVGEARLSSNPRAPGTHDLDSEVSDRLEELEASLAFTLEKNERLERSNGQLSVRSSDMHALCAELKRNVSNLKLRLRLRSGVATDDVGEYESSADAIEWRMKYEELEEAYVELQERVRATGSSNSDDSGGEVQKLNLMFFTLSKQLAHVIREKHELSKKLNGKPAVQDDEEERFARLESEMAQCSFEFESRLNSVLAMNTAVEAKAEEASLELLHAKQKEAAWKIDQQKSQVVIVQLHEHIQQLEGAARVSQESIIDERQQRVELEMRLRQEHSEAMHDVENQLAEKMAENLELVRTRDHLQSDLDNVATERESLKDQLRECENQFNVTNRELQTALSSAEARAQEMQAISAVYDTYKADQEARYQEQQVALSSAVSNLAQMRDEMSTKLASTQAELSHLELAKSKLTADLEETKRTLEKEHKERRVAETNLVVASESLVEAKEDNQKLTATIQDLKLEATKLEEKFGMFQEEASKSAQEIDELKQLAAALTQSSQAKSETIAARDATIVQLNSRISAVESELSQARSVVTELRSALRSTEAERDELASRSETLENKLTTVTDERCAAVRQVQILTGDITAKSELIRQREEALSARFMEIDDLQGQIGRVTIEGEKLRTDLEHAHRIFDEALVGHKASLSSLKDSHRTEVERIASEAAASIDKLEKALAVKCAEVEAKADEIERFQNTVANQLSTITRVECDLASERERATAALSEVEQVKADLRDREQTVSEKNEHLARANHQIETMHEAAEEERVRLSGRIQLLEADLKDLNRAHDILTSSHSTLTKLHEETVTQKRRVEEMSAEYLRRNGELTKQVNDLMTRSSTLSASIERLEGEVLARTKEIQDWKQQKEDADVATANLKQLVSQRDDELDEKDSVISGMEETVENLEADKQRGVDELRRVEEELSATSRKLLTTEDAYRVEVEQHAAAQGRLREKLEALTRELDSANQVIASQKIDMQRNSNTVETLSKDIKDLASKKLELEERIAAGERARQEEGSTHEASRHSWEKTMAEVQDALRAAECAKHASEEALAAKLSELDDCKHALEASRSELSDLQQKSVNAEEERASQIAVWGKTEAALTISIKELQQLVDEQRQAVALQKNEADETISAIESEMSVLRQELDHSVEKVSRQRKRNDTLVETNLQLSRDLEEKASTIQTLEQKLLESQDQQSTTEAAMQQTRLELAASKDEFTKLEAKHGELLDEFNSAKEDLQKKQANWEAKDKELQGRTSVLGEMEVQIADASKKLTEEKVSVAQKKKEVEKIRREYEQLKVRVGDLEALKIQLSKEKEKYRREVAVLTQKLDQISKENDKLVGHDNKRQRIQHHIKVKEENNRLQSEVRRLTEEKLKLEVRIGRLELSLKEKENLVNDAQVDFSGSPSSTKSNSSLRTFAHGVSSPEVRSSLFKTSESGSGEPSSARKRMRTRLE